MNTISNVEIIVKGASLTTEEKEQLEKAVIEKLNGNDSNDVLKFCNNGKTKRSEIIGKAKACGESIIDKAKGLDAKDIVAIAIGIPTALKAWTGVSTEMRLRKKEKRLQKEAKYRDKIRKMKNDTY